MNLDGTTLQGISKGLKALGIVLAALFCANGFTYMRVMMAEFPDGLEAMNSIIMFGVAVVLLLVYLVPFGKVCGNRKVVQLYVGVCISPAGFFFLAATTWWKPFIGTAMLALMPVALFLHCRAASDYS